ncbi:ACP S-malonyltransferase [Oceanibacterium hippocampi]|uniref:Malonyl CoA-acyl carrier protein transacylase n=1 Tax=Oceanibacterium hippocampi TaxID=745714 RepID=A0A1Y5SYT1_9PROT|nr:ACP S-malonyltransferase [Oceanibacterium hippocampi]SLN48186.1 Malonyl CoA-acyl carrier protein transacylase [Oceanibacterium hippocampi]
MTKRAFVFPGQGSQAVGMGQALAEAFPVARQVFEEVDDALGLALSRLMAEGPEDTLRLTENAQPALMASSLAVLRVLETEGGVSLGQIASFVAGHSLGEYSALTAAGSLTLGDAARLLQIRGRAMQQAVPVGEGAMAALLGLDFDVAVEVAAAAADDEICVAANDNAPGQVVISGHAAAVDRAIELAKEKGGRRSIKLPVSAPFHCPLMAPAAEAMAAALEGVMLAPPVVPLIANVTASPISDPETIKARLVDQVTALVRWRESVLCMRAYEVEQQVEIGTGKVLSGMVKRIDRELATVSVESPADVEAFLKTL